MPYSLLPVLTTKIHQAILHSITDIMAAAAADVMDMDTEQDKDKTGYTISRILTVRRPRYRESSSWVRPGEKQLRESSSVNRES